MNGLGREFRQAADTLGHPLALEPEIELKLIFYSCASVFDVSPLLMDQESYRSNKHSATLHRIFPLKSRSIAV